MNQEEFTGWLIERLTGERAQQEWAQLLQGSFEAAFDLPLSQLLEKEQLLKLVQAHLTEERLVELSRPAVRFVLQQGLLQAREDQAPLERFVSKEARARIEQLAARPGIIKEEWIEQLFSQEAMEELGADTLYKALKDFSKIIPRIIEGLTPSALGKLARLGGRATGGVGGKLLDEVERRLEPEIKRWLERGTRKALDGAARFTIERRDGPAALEARKNMVRFFIGQSAAFHAASFTDEVVEDLDQIVELLARHLAGLEETQERLAKVITSTYEAHGTLRGWLQSMGVEGPPPYTVWAEVSWSVWRALSHQPPVQDWLQELSKEIHDKLSNSP